MTKSPDISVNEALAQAQNKLIEELLASERRYADLVGNLRDTVFQLDSQFCWTFLNASWEVLSGVSVEQSLGRSFEAFFDAQGAGVAQWQFRQLLSGEVPEICLQLNLKQSSGQVRVVELSCRATRDNIGRLSSLTGTMTDITQRVEAENKVTHMAYHDALTGLANRRMLLQALNAPTEPGKCCALLYIDLDHFKSVNDLHGHVIGDAVLCEVGKRLLSQLEAHNAVAARIGGDEFCVLLNLPDSGEASVQAQLEALAEQLRLGVSRRMTVGIVHLSISVSIGVVQLDAERMLKDDALKFADAAMYRSKLKGRNTVQFYDSDIDRQNLRQQAFEGEIRRAVEMREFELYYQPQIDIQTQRIVKLEALIRWNHPQRGMINPDAFIPYLEESGLIVEVGRWVLRQGCRQISAWSDQGISDLCLSLNVSANQFRMAEFIDEVTQAVAVFSIAPGQLELELTEGVAVHDIHVTTEKMKQLKELGVKIALDDFGTGYSSLAYLKYLPVQTLKIDKSFIKGVPRDGYDAAIVETTMVMARHLGLEVVAEGVEKPHQLAFLKSHGCQLYQGYLYSRALSSEDIFALLSRSIATSAVASKV
ncbi:MAG: putative bifunctional diguanylate cyclase/phosphodiesterase [Pseudomonadales bacterium]